MVENVSFRQRLTLKQIRIFHFVSQAAIIHHVALDHWMVEKKGRKISRVSYSYVAHSIAFLEYSQYSSFQKY